MLFWNFSLSSISIALLSQVCLFLLKIINISWDSQLDYNWYCLLFWQGPSPLTLFIMEDLLVRRYANGGMFGTGFALSSASSFKTVISIVVNEKHLQTSREGMSFILLKFATLQDGTVKIGQNTVVSRFLFQCGILNMTCI